jgi:diadenosine tetraphosphate (Ap4A) HIT family hydrolase
MAPCIFCKIIKGMLYLLLSFMETELLIGDIPSFKLFESEKVLAFLDIQPLSRGHAVCSIAYPQSDSSKQ